MQLNIPKAWLGLTQYYATAFKTGSYPTIEKDQIYMWSRPHSSSAQAPDPVGQPDNFQLVSSLANRFVRNYNAETLLDSHKTPSGPWY